MGVHDVVPLDRDVDLRKNSEYLTTTDIHELPPAALCEVYVDLESNSKERRRACEQALEQACILSRQLVARSQLESPAQDGESIDTASSSSNDSKYLIERLEKWLLEHETQDAIQETVDMLECLMPHITLLEYFDDSEKPEVTKLHNALLLKKFLNEKQPAFEGLTSRMIYINYGRSGTSPDDSIYLDVEHFDYALIWMSALFEKFGLSADLLNQRPPYESDMEAGTRYYKHNMTPSFTSRAKEMVRKDPFKSHSFFLQSAGLLAAHLSRRKEPTDSVDLHLVPSFVVSHFSETAETQAKRIWTGIHVASSTESNYLRCGGSTTEDMIDEALLQSDSCSRTIVQDPTKPLRHIYECSIERIHGCFAETRQILDSFNALILRRPFEIQSAPLFHTWDVLQDAEYILNEHRHNFAEIRLGPSTGVNTSWVEVLLRDLDFMDQKLAELKSQVNETRTLLFNTISILESQKISTLTTIAFIFIPISLSASLFSMNVDVLSGTPPSIGIFFAVAVAILFLTIATSIGYKPVRLRMRKATSRIERRMSFHRYMSKLKKEKKKFGSKKWSDEFTKHLCEGFEEKVFSSQAMTNIIEKRQARSRLQDRLEEQAAESTTGDGNEAGQEAGSGHSEGAPAIEETRLG